MAAGTLFVVATPIGNLDDISARARTVLAQVDVVAAEDTRRSGKLLLHCGLERPLLALHEHNEAQQAPRLVQRMRAGESVALVSDAGTPLLSDPGYRLVGLAVESGIHVVPVPGPSALTAALSVSGLPTDRFVFEGFLPPRPGARRKRLETLRNEVRTLVVFESSHRIESCLADLETVFGPDRPVALCRELTKQFETILRGRVAEIRRTVEQDPDQRRGEFVLVIGGAAPDEGGGERLQAATELALALQPDLGTSQAARVAARIHGVPRRELYRRMGIEK